jgi:Leucine-rich repeat (LRR) protein
MNNNIHKINLVVFLFFSVNKITSLADFEDCPNLQELYLRKNCIQDINDLVYLQVRTRKTFHYASEAVVVTLRHSISIFPPFSHAI